MEELKQLFYRRFTLQYGTLKELIENLKNLSPIAGERQDAIEHILAGISRLNQEVVDVKDLLPPYELRNYSIAAKTVSDMLETERAKFEPKRRFQFRPRTSDQPADPKLDARRIRVDDSSSRLGDNSNGAETLGTLRDASGTPAQPADQKSQPKTAAERDIAIVNEKKTNIVLPPNASREGCFGRLTNLDGCIIDMSGPPDTSRTPFAGMAIKDVKESVIVAGNVDGSVHITGVHNSKLVLVARQVRIHDCDNVDLYLHCASHPIIENCKGMRFAPAPKCYLSDEQNESPNQWDQVDDFKWLKAEHSPNWRILPEEERIQDILWMDISRCKAEDLIKEMGVDLKA